MNNDLISRKALKEQIKNDYCKNYCLLPYAENYCPSNCSARYFIKIIDNAPTVNIKDQIAGAYNEGYMCGNKEAEKARPQGEWIIVDDTEKFIAKCSVCGRIEDSRMVKDYPFCHCGADMRKGGAENDVQ